MLKIYQTELNVPAGQVINDQVKGPKYNRVLMVDYLLQVKNGEGSSEVVATADLLNLLNRLEKSLDTGTEYQAFGAIVKDEEFGAAITIRMVCNEADYMPDDIHTTLSNLFFFNVQTLKSTLTRLFGNDKEIESEIITNHKTAHVFFEMQGGN